MGLDLDALKRVIEDAGGGTWYVTERSSPGWRVETESGDLVCYGPEQLHNAGRGRFIAQAKVYLPALIQELEDARDLIIQLTGEAEEREATLASLTEVRARLQELQLSADTDEFGAAEIGWVLEPVGSDVAAGT